MGYSLITYVLFIVYAFFQLFFKDRLESSKCIVEYVFPTCNTQKILDNETIYIQNSTFITDFTETSRSGDYLITAALVSSKNISDSEGIKVVNYFTYIPYLNPFMISFVSIIGLIVSLIYVGIVPKRVQKNHATTTLDALRFIFISGIALSPIPLFLITEVGIGYNSPIGLIIQPENKYSLQQDDEKIRQWMIHIVGLQQTNYSTGITFPFYTIECNRWTQNGYILFMKQHIYNSEN